FLAEHAKEVGVKTGRISIDFNKITRRRDKIVKSFRNGSESALQKNKNVKLLYGEGSFVSGKEIVINNSSDKEHITVDYCFINTGVSPLIPDIKGLKNIKYLTSKSILKLNKVPEKLVVIGASYVGLERSEEHTSEL